VPGEEREHAEERSVTTFRVKKIHKQKRQQRIAEEAAVKKTDGGGLSVPGQDYKTPQPSPSPRVQIMTHQLRVLKGGGKANYAD